MLALQRQLYRSHQVGALVRFALDRQLLRGQELGRYFGFFDAFLVHRLRGHVHGLEVFDALPIGAWMRSVYSSCLT